MLHVDERFFHWKLYQSNAKAHSRDIFRAQAQNFQLIKPDNSSRTLHNRATSRQFQSEGRAIRRYYISQTNKTSWFRTSLKRFHGYTQGASKPISSLSKLPSVSWPEFRHACTRDYEVSKRFKIEHGGEKDKIKKIFISSPTRFSNVLRLSTFLLHFRQYFLVEVKCWLAKIYLTLENTWANFFRPIRHPISRNISAMTPPVLRPKFNLFATNFSFFLCFSSQHDTKTSRDRISRQILNQKTSIAGEKSNKRKFFFLENKVWRRIHFSSG